MNETSEDPTFQPSVECADFQPLYDFVLVRRLPDPEEQRGLVVPAQARDKDMGNRRGVVEKCGPGDKKPGLTTFDYFSGTKQTFTRHDMNVRPGDVVLYSRSPANEVRLNEVEYQLCHEEQHLLAVIG